MTKNVHTAILPDGRVAKRTSLNRVYPYCVAVRDSYEYALMAAKQWLKVDADNYGYYLRELDPATRRYSQSEKQLAEFADEVAGCPGANAYCAKLIAKRVAAVEKAKAEGRYERWGVLGWNGRLDLAQKLCDSARAKPFYAETVIVETKVEAK